MPSRKKTPEHLLSRADLRARGIVYSPTHLRRLWQHGKFPRPLRLSERKLAWDKQAIDQWLGNTKEA
jgi:hypothetical protein